MLQNKNKKNFITSKWCNAIVVALIFTIAMCMPVFAAGDALTIAKNLLAKAAQAGGGLWAVWGLVQLGISIKDHNGPGMQGAIWQIIGGGIIIAAGTAISSLDLTFTA